MIFITFCYKMSAKIAKKLNYHIITDMIQRNWMIQHTQG